MFPDVNLIAPSLETPVPEIVIGSATDIPPEILSAAPDATVVPCPEDDPPNAEALLIAKVPALIEVVPV